MVLISRVPVRTKGKALAHSSSLNEIPRLCVPWCQRHTYNLIVKKYLFSAGQRRRSAVQRSCLFFGSFVFNQPRNYCRQATEVIIIDACANFAAGPKLKELFFSVFASSSSAEYLLAFHSMRLSSCGSPFPNSFGVIAFLVLAD